MNAISIAASPLVQHIVTVKRIDKSYPISAVAFCLGTMAGNTLLAHMPEVTSLFRGAALLLTLYVPAVIAGAWQIRRNSNSKMRLFVPAGVAFVGVLVPMACRLIG